MTEKIAKTSVAPKSSKTDQTRGRRLRDDTVLHIAETVKDEIGPNDLFHYTYSQIAKRKSVRLGTLIEVLSADKVYKDRSTQEPATHIRQLVNGLRRLGLITAETPKAEKTTAVAKKVVVVKAGAKPKTTKPVAKKPAAVAKKAVPAKTAKRRVVLDSSKPSETDVSADAPGTQDNF